MKYDISHLATSAIISMLLPVALTANANKASDKLPFKYSTCQNEFFPCWLELEGIDNPAENAEFSFEETYKITLRLDGTVDARIERIVPAAFLNSKIQSISFSKGLEVIGRDAFRNSELGQIQLEEGLKYIDSQAFASTRLEHITLPEPLMMTGFGVFMDNPNLKRVDLPLTLEELGGYTFYNDTSLEQIVCYSYNPPKADDTDFGYNPEDGTFSGPDPEKCSLYVPDSACEAYKQAPGWNRFKKYGIIKEADAPGINTGDDVPSYTVTKGTISICCHAGDIVAVYDVSGNRLHCETMTKAGEFRYDGKGILIITVNGRPIKAML